MKGDFTAWRRAAEYQPLKVLGLGRAIAKAWVARKAEATVIAGVTEDDASIGVQIFKAIETGSDERLADASALSVGPDRNRPKAIPSARCAVDRDRREGDMADYVVALHSDEREAQCPGIPQGIDDGGFRAATVRHPQEGFAGDGADHIDVCGALVADDHA
jgi:hypothetical protein